MVSVTAGSAELDQSKSSTALVWSYIPLQRNSEQSEPQPDTFRKKFFLPLEGVSCCSHVFPLLTAIDEKETAFLIVALNKVSGDGDPVCDHYPPESLIPLWTLIPKSVLRRQKIFLCFPCSRPQMPVG